MTASAPTAVKGLRFVSGKRMRSVTYTVRPAVPERDPLTGRQVGMIQPLRAVFKEHQFNSGAAQVANRWSDEERKQVEKHLIHHPDFGRTDGRGIHLDNSTTIPQTLPDYLQTEVEQEVSQAVVPLSSGPRCEWVGEEPDGNGGVTVAQCPDSAHGDLGYCEKHSALVEAATS